MANVAQSGIFGKPSRPRGQEPRPLIAPAVLPLVFWAFVPLFDHAVVLPPPLQPARSDHPLRRIRQLFLPVDGSVASRRPLEHARAGRRRSRGFDRSRLPVRGSVRPGILWTVGRAAPDHHAVLRDADGQRADLEEPPDAPGQRALRLHHALAASRRRRLVRQVAPDVDRHHRRLAMGAVRDAHSPHRDTVPRPRAGGGGAHGRRQASHDVLLHHAAPSRSPDHRRDHDRDDLPAFGLCGNPGHDQWRPGRRLDQSDLSRLQDRAARLRCRRRLGRRHRCGRSSPTSSRFSSCAPSRAVSTSTRTRPCAPGPNTRSA